MTMIMPILLDSLLQEINFTKAMAKFLIILTALLGSTLADGTGHHDHDHTHDHAAYNAPAAPQEGYGAPQVQDAYGAPAQQADAYGAPQADPQTYGAPAAPQLQTYGAPQAAPTYNAPQAAPTYQAPASAYGAPAAEYSAPGAEYTAPEYSAPAETYGAPQEYNAPSTGYSAPAEQDSDLFDLSALSSYLPFLISVFAAIVVAQIFSPLLGVLFGAKLDFASSILAPFYEIKIDLINAALSPFNLVLGNVGTCTAANGRSLGAPEWNVSPDNVLSMIYKASELYNQFS